MASTEVFRATRTFFKGEVKVLKGKLVRAGHDVMVGSEHLFEKLHVDFDHDVNATAARRAAEAKVKADLEAEKAKLEAAAKDEEPKVEADVEKDAKAVEAKADKAGS